MPYLDLILPDVLPLKFSDQNFARIFIFSHVGHMYGPS
jgi:hypothetical protein